MCNTRKTLVIKEGGKEDKYKYRKKKFIEAQRRSQKEDTNRESVTMKNSKPVCTDWWVEKNCPLNHVYTPDLFSAKLFAWTF